MKLETVLNVQRVQDNQQVTTRYEQWVNPVTNKHEQRVLVYTVDLYTSKGHRQHWTNNTQVDVRV